MMNVESGNKKEQVTDLGLTLGFSSHCIQRDFNGDSGAGVNAGSRINMAFAATDPLSELVWSPHKGLSLRCADSSFPNKKPSYIWDAGLGTVAFSPPRDITTNISSETLRDERKSVKLRSNCLPSETVRTDALAMSPTNDSHVAAECGQNCMQNAGTSGKLEGTMVSMEITVLQSHPKDTGLRDAKLEELSGTGNTRTMGISASRENNFSSLQGHVDGNTADVLAYRRNELKNSAEQVEQRTDVGCGNQKIEMEVEITSKVNPENNFFTNSENSVQHMRSAGRFHEEFVPTNEEQGKNKLKRIGISNFYPLERVESTAENDPRFLNVENGLGIGGKMKALASDDKLNNFSWKNEGMSPEDTNVSMETGDFTQPRKNKEKALSDGYVQGRISKEDNDSNESVESCNSAGLSSMGNKRCSFEEQVVNGSKRFKRQINDSPSSAIKKESSFMCWISKMVKGFTKSMQDEAPTLTLTLDHDDQGQEYPVKKLPKRNKDHNPSCLNTGFQSVFQALYSPNMKALETGISNPNQAEGSAELELGNKVCDITATPISFHRGNNNSIGCSQLSNGNLNETASRDGATQPEPLTIAYKEKSGSQSSSDTFKTNIAGEVTPDILGEAKVNHTLDLRSETLGSMWIKRLSPKVSGAVSNPILRDQGNPLAIEFSTNSAGHIPRSHDYVKLTADNAVTETIEHTTEIPQVSRSKETENCAASTEPSVDISSIKGRSNNKSIQSIPPSQRFKSSEAMASVFARRLDALKHMSPLHAKGDVAHANMTCFFCGTKGHRLQDCPEVSETEIDRLLRNVSSFNGTEESPWLCIRCFQLNHWAVSCPKTLEKGKSQLVCGDQNYRCRRELPLDTENEKKRRLLGGEKRQTMPAGTHVIYQKSWFTMQANGNMSRKSNKMMTYNSKISCLDPHQGYIASSSKKNELKENKVTTLFNSNSWRNSYAPEEVFKLVKQLRLSRSDILKWMNSHISVSCLDGFFLRLRLGKWEEGLGGTGYYVACITGIQRDHPSENAKTLISVNVGGVKCLVGIQYISDHDFLEEELMAWWCATSKSGGSVPLEEDVRTRVEERRRFGL